MNARLAKIQNWPELARRANWSAAALAKLCGVSRASLHRHFSERFLTTPRQWLTAHRQQQAIELLRDGSTIKETAACLSYKQQTNFTRQFKEFWGHCPTQLPPPMVQPHPLRQNDQQ